MIRIYINSPVGHVDVPRDLFDSIAAQYSDTTEWIILKELGLAIMKSKIRGIMLTEEEAPIND